MKNMARFTENICTKTVLLGNLFNGLKYFIKLKTKEIIIVIKKGGY